jgi:hypothetical protein
MFSGNLPGEAGRTQGFQNSCQYLKPNDYGFAAGAIDQIGGLVGGWLRSHPEATDA